MLQCRKTVLSIIFILIAFNYSEVIGQETPRKNKISMVNIFEINYGVALGGLKGSDIKLSSVSNSFGLRFVSGQYLNENISLGIGIGVDFYGKFTTAPLTVDARLAIPGDVVRVIFNPNIGYALGLDNSKGGFYMNPSIGLGITNRKKLVYLFSLGYRFQKQSTTYNQYKYYGYYGTFTENVDLSLFTFGVGIEF